MTEVSSPVRPQPASSDVQRHFVRGRVSPRGVVWFGLRSFWGHLRHFIAAAIATEDIDSRDWMTPDVPETLLQRISGVLGADTSAQDLVSALGRDVWIDYISDTGDDVSVSGAVAELLFQSYELPDPARPGEFVTAGRGDVLLFGGDTAYPVATALEITNRVLVPFNRAIERHRDDKSRVLLGIPGNHDWYDGLDGFGRMFRVRDDGDDEPRPSLFGVSKRMLEHYARWAKELVRGGKVEKPKALVLAGYTPVQNASYFALPLSRHIHLIAADRQLKNIDSRQRRFLSDWYLAHPHAAPWVLLPDPLFAFGAPSRTGTQSVEALCLDFEARPHFLLSGDIHHYERMGDGGLLHVIAGGGGAFLHPAPLFQGKQPAQVRWPNAAQSRPLLRTVPWKVARGRSGLLPHLAFAALYGPALAFFKDVDERSGMIVAAPLTITVIITTVYSLIGGLRTHARQVIPLAFLTALLSALIPAVASLSIGRLSATLGFHPAIWHVALLTLFVAVYCAVWLFGAYLSLLTRLGIEHTQAFTALDHPGFKHFLRLRVRADGKTIDAWCIGLVDPLRTGERPVLVDHFSWDSEAAPEPVPSRRR